MFNQIKEEEAAHINFLIFFFYFDNIFLDAFLYPDKPFIWLFFSYKHKHTYMYIKFYSVSQLNLRELIKFI